MTPDELLAKAIKRHAQERAKEAMNKEFVNDSTQAERREVVKNDRSTYLDHARANEEMVAQGRFAKVNATPVAGVPEYPRQPEGSPWHHDPVPTEPSLGYSVHDLPPVGTPAEVAASIAAELAKAIEAGDRWQGSQMCRLMGRC